MVSTFDIAKSIDVDDVQDFIPEIWALETVAAYKKNLVMAQLVSLIPHVGKKGDTIHIPAPARATATEQIKNTVINLITFADSDEKSVTINKHLHYAPLLERPPHNMVLP